MVITYNQLCTRCRKKYVLSTWRDRYPVCYECQKAEMAGEIKDPEMKKLFNLSDDVYKKSTFLRDMKIKYLRYGKMSKGQIDAFKKVAKKIKETLKEE